MAPVACYLSQDYRTSEESILTRQHVVATRERGSAQVKSSTGSRRRARAGTNPFQRRQDENAPQVRPSVRGASRGTRLYDRGAVSTCRHHRDRRRYDEGRHPVAGQALLPAARRACDGLLLLEQQRRRRRHREHRCGHRQVPRRSAPRQRRRDHHEQRRRGAHHQQPRQVGHQPRHAAIGHQGQPGGRAGVRRRPAPCDEKDSDSPGLKSGYAVTAEHTQNVWGGFNKLTLQRGVDAGAGLGAFNFTTTGQTTTRLLEHLVIQPSGTVSVMFAFVHQKTDVPSPTPTTPDKWTSIGARPMYHWSEHLTSTAEVSLDRVKYNGGSTGSLRKVTLAPA